MLVEGAGGGGRGGPDSGGATKAAATGVAYDPAEAAAPAVRLAGAHCDSPAGGVPPDGVPIGGVPPGGAAGGAGGPWSGGAPPARRPSDGATRRRRAGAEDTG